MTVSSLAAGMLIVIGALLALLGVFAAGAMAWTIVGLASIAAGGIIGIVAEKRPV